MYLRKVISGGQTGADEAGLEAAYMYGFETGGHAPKYYRTSAGPNLVLKDRYGLVQDSSESYPPRTLKNVQNSDATIRLAKNFKSKGEVLTLKYISKEAKPHFDVDILSPPDPRELALWIHRNKFEIINIAGNTETDGSIYEFVYHYLKQVFKILEKL